MNLASTIKWVPFNLSKLLEACQQEKKVTVLLIEEISSFNGAQIESVLPTSYVRESGLKLGVVNVATLHYFITYMIANRFSESPIALSEITIQVVGYEKLLALNPYLNVPIPFSPTVNHAAISNVAKLVLAQCADSMEEKQSIIDQTVKTDSDVIVSKEFVDYWDAWWRSKAEEVGADTIGFASLVIELASTFAYAKAHISEQDYYVEDGKVRLERVNPLYPYVLQIIEYRHNVPFSEFNTKKLTIPIRQCLLGARDVTVYDRIGLSLPDKEFEQVEISLPEERDGVKLAGSVSHNVVIETLSSIDPKTDVVLTNYAEEFDDQIIEQGNVFNDVEHIIEDDRVNVHLFYHYDSFVDFSRDMVACRVGAKNLTIHLSSRMYSDDSLVEANAKLMKGSDASLKSAWSILEQEMKRKDAVKRAQGLSFKTYLDPLSEKMVTYLNVSKEALSKQEVRVAFLKEFANHCKSVSVLQNKVMANLSYYDQ